MRIWERFRPPRKRQPPPERNLTLVIAPNDHAFQKWCNSLGHDPRSPHLVHVSKLGDIRGGVLDRTEWVVCTGKYWDCRDYLGISNMIFRYLIHHPDPHPFKMG